MNTNSDRPGVVAPPPLIFLAFLALALLVHFWLWPVPTGLSGSLRQASAALLASAALALLIGASGRFRKAGTDVRPWQPTTAIVVTGPYRWTRNPMYLGMAWLYVAAALWADSWLPIFLLWPLLETLKHGVILREERYLRDKFGDEYIRYQERVRRWW